MSRRTPKGRPVRPAATAATPTPSAAPKSLPPPGMTRKEMVREVHLAGLVAVSYSAAIGPAVSRSLTDVDAQQMSIEYVRDMIARMNPRDPAEEMLIGQLVLAHSRVLHLTYYANQQKELASLRTVHEYADRASNTYRRLMLALAEYRRPPKTGDSFTAIKQTNIAGQQIVHNSGKNENTNATNEQGCRPPDAAAPTPAPALPADTGWIGGAPDFRSPREAVESIHRTTDATGKGPIPNERPAPR